MAKGKQYDEEFDISINMLLKTIGYGKLLTLLNNEKSKIIEEKMKNHEYY